MSKPPVPVRTVVNAHLVSLLYSGTFAMVSVYVINAVILSLMLRDYISVQSMVTWWIAFSAVMALRIWLHLSFIRTAPSQDRMEPWVMWIYAISFLTGLVWGSTAWVFMPVESVEHQLFTTLIIIVVASGAVSKLYPILSVFLVFVAPLVILLMSRFLMIGSPLHFGMAASALVLLSFLTYFAMRHRDELVRSLELRMENKALLERLSRENREVLSKHSELQKMEVLLRQKTSVLDAVSNVQTLFIADRNPNDVFEETLGIILKLTNSEYGFIGEVLKDDQGEIYLKTFAITDISWNDEVQRAHDHRKFEGLEFRDQNTLFGEVLKTGEPVIANNITQDPMQDPRGDGLPQGHRTITAFLGVPLYLGDLLVGMFGIANRAKGYDDELLTALEPVITASARMIEALQSRHARQDVQDQLAEAKELAEKANMAKTEFLSSMSHELRTPMNAVLGFAQLLQLNPQVPLHPRQADSVEQILKAGNHLLELINEILDLSRIEAGRVKLEMEDIDPHEVLEDCIAYISPLAKRRGVSLSADIPPLGVSTIHTDHMRFRQVLLNLLSNAVKYNVDDGAVTLSVHQDIPGFVRFCVSDTGPGIAEDQQEEIFEPFSRLGAEATDIEGTGIGLTISRKLTELMEGRLGFESKLGHGSKFWIDLPGSAVEAAPVKEKRELNHLPAMPQGMHTVLYVEDNPDNLCLMEEVISMVDNAKLISAHTGELGVEMTQIHLPDVVLMDINLPGIDGFEALHRLRSDPETRHIPIIAVSADAMADDIRRGLAEGFDAYLTKPIDLGLVIDHLSRAIEGKLGPNAEQKN